MTEEEQLSIMVCSWVKTNTDLPFIKIANERKCNPYRGKIFKQMGVMPGVFDIFIPRNFKFYYVDPIGNELKELYDPSSVKFKEYPGLWVELKVKNRKLSQSQLKFKDMIIKEGYKAEKADGFNEAINVIKGCYGV